MAKKRKPLVILNEGAHAQNKSMADIPKSAVFQAILFGAIYNVLNIFANDDKEERQKFEDLMFNAVTSSCSSLGVNKERIIKCASYGVTKERVAKIKALKRITELEEIIANLKNLKK